MVAVNYTKARNNLKEYCDKEKICFLSTPFDNESIDFLNTIDMPFWKIPSGEVTNLPYLLALAKTGKPVVSPLNAKDGLLLNKKEERNKEKGEQ